MTSLHASLRFAHPSPATSHRPPPHTARCPRAPAAPPAAGQGGRAGRDGGAEQDEPADRADPHVPRQHRRARPAAGALRPRQGEVRACHVATPRARAHPPPSSPAARQRFTRARFDVAGPRTRSSTSPPSSCRTTRPRSECACRLVRACDVRVPQPGAAHGGRGGRGRAAARCASLSAGCRRRPPAASAVALGARLGTGSVRTQRISDRGSAATTSSRRAAPDARRAAPVPSASLRHRILGPSRI